MLQGDIGTGCDGATDQKKRRRRDIRRYIDIAGRQTSPTLQTAFRAIPVERIAESLQHPFGMVPGGSGLGDTGLSLGIEPRQQYTGFDLGTGHRQTIVDSLESIPGTDHQRCRTTLPGIDPGTHFGQRIGDPFHGATGKGTVTGQGHLETLSRQQTGEQTHGGAGIAQVEGRIGGLETMHADAVDHHLARIRARYLNSHLTKRLKCRQTVFPLEKTLDPGDTFCQRAQHDRTVGDGFITGHPQRTRELTPRLYMKFEIRIAQRCSPSMADFR